MYNRIFYGVNGEGLGHATRTISIIENMPNHEIHVFTYGSALEFFRKLGYPHLHKIQGLRFKYEKGTVDYLKTFLAAKQFHSQNLPENINIILAEAERLQPLIFVTDFEPSVPRAAKKTNRKSVSIDNQHKFLYGRMPDVGLTYRGYARIAGFLTKMMVPRPDYTIISTFHFDYTPVDNKKITMTNGFIRKALAESPITDEGFVLVYLRDSIAARVLEIIRNIPDQRFLVYSNKPGSSEAHIEQFPLSPTFSEDMTKCHKIISTAGNQLITEARFLGKPILTIPEPKQYEQDINSLYVEKLKIGTRCRFKELTEDVVREFLAHQFLTQERPANGVDTVVNLLETYIYETSDSLYLRRSPR